MIEDLQPYIEFCEFGAENCRDMIIKADQIILLLRELQLSRKAMINHAINLAIPGYDPELLYKALRDHATSTTKTDAEWRERES